MPRNWVKIGTIRMKIDHVFWRSGVAYYRRRIPKDVAKHFGDKETHTVSLGTKDFKEATCRAAAETRRLERQWAALRGGGSEELATRERALAILREYDLKPGQAAEYRKHDLEPDAFINELVYQSQSDEDEGPVAVVSDRLSDDLRMAAELFYGEPQEVQRLLCPSFSEVIDKHLYFHPARSKDPQFQRSVQLFKEINGDFPIDQYRRQHGNAFVEHLIDKGSAEATIKRYLTQIRPIFDTAIVELEIEMSNPLARLKIPKVQTDEDAERKPFSLEQVWAAQERFREVDDQRRWALAMISDTGARLSEVAGLMVEDVGLNDEIPHILIRKHKHRSLKNAGTSRKVPLVGEALWAARRAMEGNQSPYLFPILVKNGNLNRGSISAALNKWLKDQGLRGDDQPVHSFRHSMRDRLRNAGASAEIADRIGGWAVQTVGERYGVGHELAVLQRYMQDMIDAEQAKKHKAAA